MPIEDHRIDPMTPDELGGQEPQSDFEVQIPLHELPTIWEKVKTVWNRLFG